MALTFSTGAANAILATGFKSMFDTDGRINIYTGAQVAVDAAESGTLLGTCTFSATAFGAPASKVMTAAAIGSDTSADNTNTPGHFVLYNAGGTVPSSAALSTDKRVSGDIGYKTTLSALTTGGDATVNVVSTALFPASGTFLLGGVTVTYSGKTGTTFTGCTGTPAASNGTDVRQPAKDAWFDNLSFIAGGTINIGSLVIRHP